MTKRDTNSSLFKTRLVPGNEGSGKLFEEELMPREKPVECLGMTFESDEARRQHFLKLLREGLEELHSKLGGVPFTTVEDAVRRMKSIEKWPMGDDARLRELAERMRHGDSGKDLLQRWKDEVGFPHGEIEDILNLSDPPYYTACPNPFIVDFIRHYGKPYGPGSSYSKAPLAVDVTEGKNDPLYRLPSYHTKVPPKAIQHYLLHYTEPGDIVLDAFCGTGMTGVACLLLEHPEHEIAATLDTNPKWGKRHAILIDLSPAATFTASVMNAPLPPELAEGPGGELGQIIERDIIPLYLTNWDGKQVSFDYSVWSDWGECPDCGHIFRLYDIAIDYQHNRMRPDYNCPNCGYIIRSDEQKKVFTIEFDPWLGRPTRIAKTTMVLISKRIGNRAIRREATHVDEQVAASAGAIHVPILPTKLPYSHMTHERNNLPEYWGITHIHHFYTRRNYLALARVATIENPDLRRAALFAVLTILENNATRRNRFYVDARRPQGSPVGPLSNTLYVPAIQVETNIGLKLLSTLKQIAKLRSKWVSERSFISTQSATQLLLIPDNSVDFIFTDPPFGGNINYSEQNYLAEWWLRVFTNKSNEAITNPAQKKGLFEYQKIMTRCFYEYYRVLKPGRWMVMVFHNSSSAIWTAIQQSLEMAGFVVANVALLDKVHSTLHQDHKAAAVDKDLAITVYKPNQGLEDRFKLTAGTEEGVWDFVRTHLKQLPVFVAKDGKAEVIAERQNYLLFDRMVAFHVQRGVTVPLSAAEFYAGLAQRFPERDGMYFLPEQVAEYDNKRMKVKEVLQLQLFVTDEASAIQWLKQQLTKKPQTFQELHPQFLKEIGGWQKHEKPLELMELLEQNFLRYEGKGLIPLQITSWMKQSAELRKIIQDELASGRAIEENGQLNTHNATLLARAKDRWYVPDPNKAGDLEKLRERALLREFEEYRESKQKRLRVFRLEAVRAGFKKAWQERDYTTIIAVARKIPERVLQEDPKLLMWYDQALTRSDEDI